MFSFTSHYSDQFKDGPFKEIDVLVVLSFLVISAFAILSAALVSIYRDVRILREFRAEQRQTRKCHEVTEAETRT